MYASSDQHYLVEKCRCLTKLKKVSQFEQITAQQNVSSTGFPFIINKFIKCSYHFQLILFLNGYVKQNLTPLFFICFSRRMVVIESKDHFGLRVFIHCIRVFIHCTFNVRPHLQYNLYSVYVDVRVSVRFKGRILC